MSGNWDPALTRAHFRGGGGKKVNKNAKKTRSVYPRDWGKLFGQPSSWGVSRGWEKEIIKRRKKHGGG